MNPYDVLKVDKNASIEEIKKSYRTLSKIYHPDRPNGNAEQFKLISEAYEILTNLANVNINVDSQSQSQYIPILHINCTVTADLSELYTGTIKKFKVNRYQYNPISPPILEEKYLEVKIPIGFPIGQNLILLNEGSRFTDGNNQLFGNIFIQVVEKNNTAFKHDGINLIYPVTISLRRALCGFQLNIIQLDGRKLTISIDDIVYPGMTYKIPGEGMSYYSPESQLHYGDMIVVFDIEFPKELNKIQKDMLNKII